MKRIPEIMLIFLFFSLCFILIFFMIEFIKKKYKRKWENAKFKEQEKQVELSQQIEEPNRVEQYLARIKQEDAEKCNTLEGFVAERKKYYEMAIAQYAIATNRDKQIIWDSIRIIFESKTPATMQSRINIIRNKTIILGQYAISHHVLRLIATHYYLIQIAVLQEKIECYKTNNAKEKAKLKINELFENALKDELVYAKAVLEYQKTSF